jgi:hypothetical protein
LFDNSIANTDKAIVPREILHIVEDILFLQVEEYTAWAKPIVDVFNML